MSHTIAIYLGLGLILLITVVPISWLSKYNVRQLLMMMMMCELKLQCMFWNALTLVLYNILSEMYGTQWFLCAKVATAVAYLRHRNSAVCPSVHPSHRWISQKLCKVESPNLHHQLLPGRLVSGFWTLFHKVERVDPQRGRWMTGGSAKFVIF